MNNVTIKKKKTREILIFSAGMILGVVVLLVASCTVKTYEIVWDNAQTSYNHRHIGEKLPLVSEALLSNNMGDFELDLSEIFEGVNTNVAWGMVSDNGTVIYYDDRNMSANTLVPYMVDGEIKWLCFAGSKTSRGWDSQCQPHLYGALDGNESIKVYDQKKQHRLP